MLYFFPTLAPVLNFNKNKVSEIFIDLKILKSNFLEVKVLRKYKHPSKNLFLPTVKFYKSCIFYKNLGVLILS